MPKLDRLKGSLFSCLHIISAKKTSHVDVRTDMAIVWEQLCLNISIAYHVTPDSQVTARRAPVVHAREALMQIIAAKHYAHHAILVHFLRYKALNQPRPAQSALEGGMLHHQALKRVLTALQALLAVKLDYLSTVSALWGDTPTPSRNGTAKTARRAAIRKPKARQSALSVRLVLTTVRRVP